MSKLTVKEYRNFFSNKSEPEEDDAVMARVTGIDAGELAEMPYSEYRRLWRKFFARCRQPDSDPNG